MKKSWNISIVVILLLVLSTLAGFLILYSVKQLAIFSWGFYNYYKSLYLANAGLELQLSKIAFHSQWFEDSVLTWSFVAKNNIDCGKGKCSFETFNVAKNSSLMDIGVYDSWCSGSKTRIIKPWEALVVPLFFEEIWTGQESFQTWQLVSVFDSLFSLELSVYTWNILITFVPWSWDISSESVYSFSANSEIRWKSLQKIFTGQNINFIKYESFYNYVVFANPIEQGTWESAKICLLNEGWSIVLPETYIVSKWIYNDTIVVLQTTKKVAVPGFLSNTFIWNSN